MRKLGCAASCSATAMAGGGVVVRAALQAGEDGLVDRRACSAVDMIMAPRGPRRVLWVVVVITSA